MRQLRAAVTSSAALGVVWAFSAPAAAAAKTPTYLAVTRGSGSEACPDTEQLARHVERLRGRPEQAPTGAYDVRFSLDQAGLQATIRSDTGDARVLRDRGPSCSALEQATAVTLALLLDSDGQRESEARAAGTLQPEPQPREVSATAERPARSAVSVTLSLGGAALVGVVRPLAPALSGELGLSIGRLRTSLGVLALLPQTLTHGPGTLHESLLSGVGRTCLAATRGAALRLDVCSGLYVGRLQVEAHGYTRNERVAKTWLAVPLELALSSSTAPLGFELGAAALLPLRRSDFAIDGVGVAYRSLPIGAVLSLRGVGVWVL